MRGLVEASASRFGAAGAVVVAAGGNAGAVDVVADVLAAVFVIVDVVVLCCGVRVCVCW